MSEQIRNLDDLLVRFGASDIPDLERLVSRHTANWVEANKKGFCFGTNIEGDSSGEDPKTPWMTFPINVVDYERNMAELDHTASVRWALANRQCIVCDGPLPEHDENMWAYWEDESPICEQDACYREYYKIEGWVHV